MLYPEPHVPWPQPNATCLADWHAVLHASHLAAHLRGEQGWAADPLPCRPAATAALKEACLQLAEQCRPEATDGSSSAAREGAAALCRMHGLLVSHLCQAHVCDKRRKRTHLMAVAQVRGGFVMAQANRVPAWTCTGHPWQLAVPYLLPALALAGMASVGGRLERYRCDNSRGCCTGLLAAAVARAVSRRCQKRHVSAPGGGATPAGGGCRGPGGPADCGASDVGQVACTLIVLRCGSVRQRPLQGLPDGLACAAAGRPAGRQWRRHGEGSRGPRPAAPQARGSFRRHAGSSGAPGARGPAGARSAAALSLPAPPWRALEGLGIAASWVRSP